MKSFEEHLRGAKAHNREDKIWLVTCFSGKMAKLCAKYGFPDDEDTNPNSGGRPFFYASWKSIISSSCFRVLVMPDSRRFLSR